MRNVLLGVEADRLRLEEFRLFDVRAVHFVEFPVVAVSVDHAGVLYVRVDLVHVLDAPVTARNGLSQGENFVCERVLEATPLYRKEDGHQREAYPSGVFLCLQMVN